MLSVFINTILSIIAVMLTTIVGLHFKDNFKKRKEYKSFLERLKNIVGLGGKIIIKHDKKYQLCHVEKIDENGVILTHKHKKFYFPINKLMKEVIIVPDTDYERYIEEQKEQDREEQKERDEQKQKKFAEIYAHTFKEVFKTYILPELKKHDKKNNNG
jgi:hypothetical protein